MYLPGYMAFDMSEKIEDNMAAGGDNCPAVPGSALTSHCIAATRRKCRIVPGLPGSCGNTRCSFCLFMGQYSENGSHMKS